MNTWRDLSLYDGVKYSYQDAENDTYEEKCGTVSEIHDDYVTVFIDEFDGDLIVDDYNCYFVEPVPYPTPEEKEIIRKAVDIYWERVNENEEDSELCMGDVYVENFGMSEEEADHYLDMWSAYYGWSNWID